MASDALWRYPRRQDAGIRPEKPPECLVLAMSICLSLPAGSEIARPSNGGVAPSKMQPLVIRGYLSPRSLTSMAAPPDPASCGGLARAPVQVTGAPRSSSARTGSSRSTRPPRRGRGRRGGGAGSAVGSAAVSRGLAHPHQGAGRSSCARRYGRPAPLGGRSAEGHPGRNRREYL